MAHGNGEARPQKAKKIIICCDGTRMDSDSHKEVPTNVTRLRRAIKSEDSAGHAQISWYQAGVGTGLGPYERAAGGGCGLGFSRNIREAYGFLANTYWEKDPSNKAQRFYDLVRCDTISLVGYSRGAHIARSLGGLIVQLGLLTKENMRWFLDIFEDWQNAGKKKYQPKFWAAWNEHNLDMHVNDRRPPKEQKIWSNPNDPNETKIYLDEYKSALLAQGLTRDVKITAIGVFDTVGAMGVPNHISLQKFCGFPTHWRRYQFGDTSLNNHVENAFQALALDEGRSCFSPSIWEREEGCTTNLKQVWFAGVHANIGGGHKDTALENLSLAWMMDQLAGTDTDTAEKKIKWLEFNEDDLKDEFEHNKRKGTTPQRTPRWGQGTIYDSRTPIHTI